MKRILGAALLVASLAACGGMSGNPHEFIVSFSNAKLVAGSAAACPSAETDPKVTETNFNEDRRFNLFQGDKDHWYLSDSSIFDSSSNGQLVEGTKKDNTFTFTLNQNDDQSVVFAGSKQGDLITKRTLTVTVTLDGSKVKGNFTSETASSCTETVTGFCHNTTPSDCVGSADFTGVELRDPEYKQITNNG